MVYGERDDNLVLKGLGLLVILIVLIGLGFGLHAWLGKPRSATEWAHQFDVEVMQNPDFGPAMVAFQKGFPTEFAAFRQSVIDQARAGASGEQIRLASFSFMRDFGSQHRHDLQHAPHPYLAAFRNDQIDVTEALQRESSVLCAHYVMTGLTGEDRPGIEATRALAVTLGAQIEATAAGRDHPAMRSTAPLSPREIAILTQAMRAQGATAEEQALMPRIATASPEQQCAFGSHLMAAVRAMPDAQADRFTAFLLSHA